MELLLLVIDSFNHNFEVC